MPQEVTLERATRRDAALLANLLELYMYDLSDIFSLKLGADGRFGYDKLALYWSEPDRRFAYLIRADGALAGFALVMHGAPDIKDADAIDMAEFSCCARTAAAASADAQRFYSGSAIRGAGWCACRR